MNPVDVLLSHAMTSWICWHLSVLYYIIFATYLNSVWTAATAQSVGQKTNSGGGLIHSVSLLDTVLHDNAMFFKSSSKNIHANHSFLSILSYIVDHVQLVSPCCTANNLQVYEHLLFSTFFASM